jgi:phthalate 4,5-cis-dihydrodiol dehydrogenase
MQKPPDSFEFTLKSTPSSPLRVGIVGLGAAAQAFLPAFAKNPGFEWVAFAEPDPNLREKHAHPSKAALAPQGYASLQEMLQANLLLDVIYVATPTDLHLEHVSQALAADCHVLVEKPMASRLSDALEMVKTAERHGKLLMVGHSHSYDRPILEMRRIIESGRLGRVQMAHTWCFTDWMYRPRRVEELDYRLGGGVTYRQGAHQMDILRYLCGGLVRSVRAKTFDWDPRRSGVGAHTVFLDFEDGPAATAIYNGYGGFSSMDLGFDISEWGFEQPYDLRTWKRRPAPDQILGAQDELKAKKARAASAIPATAPHQPFFGLTLVSCEGGDIRQTPNGLSIDGPNGRENIDLTLDTSPRDLVLLELLNALRGAKLPVHTGAWGVANLEVCEASISSSQERKEVTLKHQVAVSSNSVQS